MMGWYYGNAGWGSWLPTALMMTVIWAALIFAGVALFRGLRRETPALPTGPANAQRLLNERFARGEIDADDYQTRSDLLKC